jgi:hypothetical protein
MAGAIVAALAALAGVLLQSLIGDWRARAERRREAVASAVHVVLDAAVRLRNRQYLKHTARRDGVEDSVEARRERYDARSDLTSGLDLLYLATGDQQLIAAAQRVFDTAVALGDAGTEAEVEEAGLRARQAHTALRQAAHHALYR